MFGNVHCTHKYKHTISRPKIELTGGTYVTMTVVTGVSISTTKDLPSKHPRDKIPTDARCPSRLPMPKHNRTMRELAS